MTGSIGNLGNKTVERGSAETITGPKGAVKPHLIQYGQDQGPQQVEGWSITIVQPASSEIRHPGNTQRDMQTALTEHDKAPQHHKRGRGDTKKYNIIKNHTKGGPQRSRGTEPSHR